jgi:isopentenyldiphosphate isomerase
MGEYLDVLDSEGNLTGISKARPEIHASGDWHATVHVYICRFVKDEIEFLVHLRSATKDSSPNMWDTRFGGYVQAGETSDATALSELAEEIGIAVELHNLKKGRVHKHDGYPNCEFATSYYYFADLDIAQLKFNDGEVQTAKWMPASQIKSNMELTPKLWTAGLKGFIETYEEAKKIIFN